MSRDAGESAHVIIRDFDEGSRFTNSRRLSALAILLATAALIIYGLLASLAPINRTAGVNPDRTDDALYVAIAARVSDGENYYRAAVIEHRERGYPLRPFLTVREPALAYVTASIGGPERMKGLLAELALVTAFTIVWRFETTAPGRPSWSASAAVTALTAGALVGHIQAVTHEVWAGMFIALSIALRAPRRFGASVGLGLAAVLVRELALPYLFVMAYFAWREKRPREMWWWFLAVVVFVFAFAAHAVLVLAQTESTDLSSQGWLTFGGWPFILDFVRASSFLAFVPGWIAAAVIPLSFLGWLSRRTPFADRVTMVIGTYMCAFLVIGRTENVYWGFLFVLLLLPGVVFAPSALWQLGKRVIS